MYSAVMPILLTRPKNQLINILNQKYILITSQINQSKMIYECQRKQNSKTSCVCFFVVAFVCQFACICKPYLHFKTGKNNDKLVCFYSNFGIIHLFFSFNSIFVLLKFLQKTNPTISTWFN